jgi:hypothetical protein
MFDEPKNDMLTLYGVNDTNAIFEGVCVVTDVENGEKLIEKKVCIKPHTSNSFAEIPYVEEQKCYHIAWESVDLKGENHYYNNMPEIDYQKYLSQLRKIGFVGELEEI